MYNCTYCKKTFKRSKSRVKNPSFIFCSKACWYKYKSESMTVWNKGLTAKDDSRLLYHRPTKFKKGQHASIDTQFKKGEASGNNNRNWKGGVTPLNTAIRQTYKYRQWRCDVFTRDNYTCNNCGSRGIRLHAHHIDKFADIIKRFNIKTIYQAINCEELWNINNGETLCVSCHSLTKSYLQT